MFKCINYVVKLQIDIGEMILNTREGRFYKTMIPFKNVLPYCLQNALVSLIKSLK